MKTLHWSILAMATMLGSSCVDTVNSDNSSGVFDDVPLVGEDAFAGNVGKDVAVTEPEDSASQTAIQPWVCAVDKDCAAIANACNLGTCKQGLCMFHTLAADAPCDDGDPCTVNTTCQRGACIGAYVCFNLPKLAPIFPAPPSPEHHTSP